MNYNFWKEMLKLAAVVIFAVAVVMLVGCASRIPEYMDGCAIAPYVQQWETIEECKMAVLKKEDFTFQKQQQELQDELSKRECWRCCKGVWDMNSRTCRSGGML